MRGRFVSIVFYVILFSVSAQAAICNHLLDQSRIIPIELKLNHLKLSSEDQRQLARFLDWVERSFAGRIPLPPKFNWTISRFSNDNLTAFDNSGVSISWQNSNRLPKGPRHSISLLAHESGHLIFNHTLFERIAYLRNILEAQANIQRKLDQSRGESREIREKVELLEAEMNSNQKKLETFMFEIAGPYNELFADIVAVAYQDDPRAISSYFSNNHYSLIDLQQNPEVGERDFRRSDRYYWQMFEEWAALDLHGDGPSHIEMHPTRLHVWTRYLKRYKNGTSKQGEVLSKLFDAMIAETEEAFERFDHGLPSLSIQEKNKHLIRRIDQTLLGY